MDELSEETAAPAPDVSAVGLPASPAAELAGLRLRGKASHWDVLAIDSLQAGESGRNFSACYTVADAANPSQKYFLKAIDLYPTLKRSTDIVADLLPELIKVDFEIRLLELCRGQDRVVTAVDSGQYRPPGEDIPIPFLVFELAEGDLNRHLATAGDLVTFAWKVRAWQHIATGVKQLHGRGVAHQDVKPSNAVVTRSETKIIDLGRASRLGEAGPHDHHSFPGDPGYKPPEFRYGFVHPEFERRRFGADVYMLGALGVYLFTQLHLNVIVENLLAPEYRPGIWQGGFEAVLPYYRDAFYRALEIIREQFPPSEIRQELLHIVTWLCEPDPLKRGFAKMGQVQPSEFSLSRLLTKLDALANMADIEHARLAARNG